MKQRIINILREKNLDINNYNIELLYNEGLNNIIENIEFYFDKPYSCESVFKELFQRGIIEHIKKTQSNL